MNSLGAMDLQVLDDLTSLNDVANGFRKIRWDHRRMCWDDHVEQLVYENQFNAEYQMSLPAHVKLVQILDPILSRKEYKSNGS